MAKIPYKQVTQEQRDKAQENGVSVTTVKNRLSRGWSIEDAIGEKTMAKGGRNDSSRMINVKKALAPKEHNSQSESWFAGPREMLQCPVDGCNHTGLVITKAHCRIEHEMDRDKVAEIYGMPKVLTFDSSKMPREQSYFVGNSLK